MVPITVSVVVSSHPFPSLTFFARKLTKTKIKQIGGVVYALIMGAITGYFSAAVGMLFVIAGIVGIVSASFSRKALAVFVSFKLSLFPSTDASSAAHLQLAVPHRAYRGQCARSRHQHRGSGGPKVPHNDGRT